MRILVSRIACLVLWASVTAITGLHAQQTPFTSTVLTPVPRLMWFSGAFRPADRLPVATVESVTVTVYRDQAGGDALWQETQQVSMAADGRYSLLMGSTLADGLPLDVFTSGEPRWIGITVNRAGEVEQPRVHLASVPYALKAADADTLGGLPASAYLLADAAVSPSAAPDHAPADTTTAASSGTAGSLGMFVDSANLGNSALVQSGSAIGLGTTAPRDAFHVAINDVSGAITGLAVQNLSGAPGAYSGMLFYDQNGALGQFQGFNNATHEYRINNIASGGRINFMIGGSSHFLVANNGRIGLGVSVPVSKLDVGGDINVLGTLRVRDTPVLRFPSGPPLDAFVGVGAGALGSNTSGTNNTGLGYAALSSNSMGDSNTAAGHYALSSNTLGANNTGVGASALRNNSIGSDNTATGRFALLSNSSGSSNTAIGVHALLANSSGANNTGVGAHALQSNSFGTHNTAAGYNVLFFNSAGASNTGVGALALYNTDGTDPTTASFNTALGHGALYYNSTGSNNIAVGYNAGTGIRFSNNNHIIIGAEGVDDVDGTIRIGTPGTQTSFFAAGVRDVTTGQSNGVAVVVDSNGQFGTVSSSRRFKEDIQDMGAASRGLLRLRPVTFRYKKSFADGAKPIQYGLIAEEVAEVYPDLVAHSADGQIQTVKYQVLDAMLLNEVQQQHAEIQVLQQQNKDLQRRLAALEAALARRR